MGFGQDAVPYLAVERPGHGRLQQGRRIVAEQPAHDQVRQAREHGLLVARPEGEDHGEGLRPEPAGDELEHLHRGPVQPLHVVHHADERFLLGDHDEQVQDRQAEQKRIRHGARPDAERGAESVPLRGGKLSSSVEERAAQLVQAGVGELHLRLDARRPGDLAPRCLVDEELEESRLADACLAAQHQDATVTGAHLGHEAAQGGALPLSPAQRRPRSRSRHPTASDEVRSARLPPAPDRAPEP